MNTQTVLDYVRNNKWVQVALAIGAVIIVLLVGMSLGSSNNTDQPAPSEQPVIQMAPAEFSLGDALSSVPEAKATPMIAAVASDVPTSVPATDVVESKPVVYNPQERPVYTAGEDPKGNDIRARFESIFEPIVAREVRISPDKGAVTFTTDKVVLGDVLVNGVPVFRDAGKEAEVTVLPAGFTLECPWWCSVYETTDLRPADALAREFIAGCTDQDGVGCQSVAWHWFEGSERKDAQFASLEALFVTPCSFWLGKRMPAGASCLVEAGHTATVGGTDPFITVYDLSYTWAYSAHGQRDFTGHLYLYNPVEFSVVAYK